MRECETRVLAEIYIYIYMRKDRGNGHTAGH